MPEETTKAKAKDNINPDHYKKGTIETIDVIEAMGWAEGFALGNAMKYLMRAGHKDPAKEIEDLSKIIWYVLHRIHQLEPDDAAREVLRKTMDRLLGTSQEVEDLHVAAPKKVDDRWVYDWPAIVYYVRQLVEQLRDAEIRPEVLIAIARGGLVPATLLAHAMEIDRIVVVGFQSYPKDGLAISQHSWGVSQAKSAITDLHALVQHDRTLIVDDIYDTGRTLERAKEAFPGVKTAVLIKRDPEYVPALHQFPQVQGVCDFWAGMHPSSKWIQFPWEL